MKKKIKNTAIDGPICKMGRAVGNTTRQVDTAIQWLFKGFTVEVRDYFSIANDSRKDMCANQYLLMRITQRLNLEHNIDITKKEMAKVDARNCTIELLS